MYIVRQVWPPSSPLFSTFPKVRVLQDLKDLEMSQPSIWICCEDADAPKKKVSKILSDPKWWFHGDLPWFKVKKKQLNQIQGRRWLNQSVFSPTKTFQG